ncbi:MAG: hypothetical protein JSV84_09665, partial [Gemmatimonadota bacterium]
MMFLFWSSMSFAQCTVTVTAPNGSETWCAGEIQDITWSSSNTSGDAKIEYSTDGGSNWQEVISSTPDDGAYSWTIPDTPSSNCLVKICDVTDPSCWDQSNGSFTIKKITVTSPNGGEMWCEQATENITWLSQHTSGNVKIEYSTDNGSNWLEVIGSTPDDGTYEWTIPVISSTTCLVKVCDELDTDCCDQS